MDRWNQGLKNSRTDGRTGRGGEERRGWDGATQGADGWTGGRIVEGRGGVDGMGLDGCLRGEAWSRYAPALESGLRRRVLRGQRSDDPLSVCVSCLRCESQSSGDENFRADVTRRRRA